MSTAQAHDPFHGFHDRLGGAFWLGAPISARQLAAFGRALHAGLDTTPTSFEKSRTFISNANDRIVNKSIGILQFNAVILAVVVLLIDEFGSNNLAVMASALCVILSALALLMNMHLFTMRDATIYADQRRHFFQQLVLFQRRARYQSLGLFLSLFGLMVIGFAPIAPLVPIELRGAKPIVAEPDRARDSAGTTPTTTTASQAGENAGTDASSPSPLVATPRENTQQTNSNSNSTTTTTTPAPTNDVEIHAPPSSGP
jgi:hypothetical protein